ncbi:MAG: flagellar hook-associated 2 domain protein [Thermoleophilia bacterium]|nr:flagellar hook-associated 2 domain protein [Thermoleophilia bacterium]
MSNFAVGGLASGLDTKSIISQLMSIDSRPKTLMEWKSQLGTTRTNAWTDLKNRLSTLKTSADALMRFDAWTVGASTPATGPLTATSANSGVAGATVTGTPAAGSYAVNVTQLARGEVDTSSGNLGPATSGVRTSGAWYRGTNLAVASTTKLTALKTSANVAMGVTAGSKITMNYAVNGVPTSSTYSVTSTSTVAQFASWVQSTVGNGATASFDAAGKLNVTTAPGTSNALTAMSFSAVDASNAALNTFNSAIGAASSTTTAASDGTVGAGGDTLTIAGAGGSWNVALAAGDDKQAVVNKINATSGIGVVASLVGSNIRLQSASIGGTSAFTVSSSGATAASLGFAETQSAQDAQYTVDGAAHTSASNSNIANGVTGLSLNLSSVGSTTLTVAQGSATGQSAQDAWIDSTVAKIKTFATNYNATLSQVYNKTQGENRVASPKTLGDYLQGSMSRNYEYGQYGFNLRSALSDDVVGLPPGQGNLASIGITASFDTKAPATNGQLVIDETALRAALKADPAHVQAVLTQQGTDPSTTNDDGFLRRISASALNSDIALTAKLDSLGKDTVRLQKSIEQAEDRLANRQKYYEHMYASMETVLGGLQTKSSWLSGQLAGLQGGSG